MKKFFITLTSLVLICIISIGCSQTDANIETSKALNKNLNLLTNTINRLDTIDNEYLVNNDLYKLENINTLNQVPTQNKTKDIIKLANSNNVIIEENNLQSQLKEALTNEIINRLFCDANGNCKLCEEKYICDENGNCKSCNQTVICDGDGNCLECGKTLNLQNNNCLNCGSDCVKTANSNTCGQALLTNLQTISNHNEEMEIEFLNIENNHVSDNNIYTYDNNSIDFDNNYTFDTISSDDNLVDKIDTFDTNFVEIVSEDNLSNQINEPVNSDNIPDTHNIEETIQNENPMDNNVIDNVTNNSTIDDTMGDDTLDDTIDDDHIDDNNKTNETPSIKYYYYSEESFNPNILRYRPRFISNVNYSSANSNIERYIEKLQKLYTMTADVVEANNTLANYKVIILNDIDEARKLNDCILAGNCSPTNNQRQALDNYIVDIRNTINHLRNCNGDLVSEINKISSGNTGIAHSIDVTNSNYLRILNHIDTRISYHENAIATLEQIKYILEDAQNNNDTSMNIEDLNENIKEEILDDYIESNEDISILPSQEEDNTIIIIEKTDEDISTDESSTSDITETPDIDNDESDDNEDFEEDAFSNIDTYDEPTYKNLDLYENNLSDLDEQDTSDTTENNISNDENNYINDNTDSVNTQDNENIDDNNNTNNINNHSQIVDDQYNNEFGVFDNTVNDDFNSTSFNGNYNYSNGFNGNNLHENTIISQNNINGNDLENNAYHYDEDGHLYNNTNGYNSDNITNINNNNNNVNTYKYNTLIDSINRGTVNNGINNLSIA